MTERFRMFPTARLIASAAVLTGLSACATAPAGNASLGGQQLTIEGDVVRVDTDPWAYDGNAVVTVSTATMGTVSVQLPARWNLCKAPPPGEVQALKPGDRVQAIGTMSDANELVVCEQPQHVLRKID